MAFVVLVGAAVLGVALGGSLGGLTTLPLRGRPLVAWAVLAQLVGGLLTWLTGSGVPYAAGLVVSALAAFGFCARNLRLAGVPLITLGLVLNALVVAANGAMPVSIEAAARADVAIGSIAAGTDPRHTVAGRQTTWRSLGDIVPVPLPLRPEVVSPGDVLVAAGLGELVVLALRRHRRSRGRSARVVAWG